jgi:hypothetical protein
MIQRLLLVVTCEHHEPHNATPEPLLLACLAQFQLGLQG